MPSIKHLDSSNSTNSEKESLATTEMLDEDLSCFGISIEEYDLNKQSISNKVDTNSKRNLKCKDMLFKNNFLESPNICTTKNDLLMCTTKVSNFKFLHFVLKWSSTLGY